MITKQKVDTIINKNTFYFFNSKFEDEYEGHVNSLKETLLNVKNQVEIQGLKKEIFEDLIANKDNGLKSLLALTGFSNEYLKRLITLVRIVDNEELNKLTYKDKWHKATDSIRDYSDKAILNLIKSNKYFKKGIVNVFFEGASVDFLAKTIPVFELKKLSISKLKFEIDEIIDTLVRYKEKGSYSGKKDNNPEIVIENILQELDISWDKGDLSELIKKAPNVKRTMDFIIPNKENPKIIIESSFLSTTSSGQGDKSKTEISVGKLIKKYYPKAKFIGFIGGIGWYVRKNDLQRMVVAYDDVFTFHDEELERFKKMIKQRVKNGQN